MEVFEAIKKRRSIRKFDSSKKVTDEQIEQLLDAATRAPSAGNLQSWFFVVARDEKTKKDLVKAALGQDFIAQAPVIIVACGNLERSALRYSARGSSLYAIQDATLAAYNLWLKAVDLDLASVWVGAFDEKRVAEILDLSDHLRPIAILPIGYPAESPKAPPRRPIKEISKKI